MLSESAAIILPSHAPISIRLQKALAEGVRQQVRTRNATLTSAPFPDGLDSRGGHGLLRKGWGGSFVVSESQLRLAPHKPVQHGDEAPHPAFAASSSSVS